uniref:Uncharacterized protein n=1 Tax=Zea mays TaxID=4577 RepID=A0A804Q8P7_MAIZE
MCTQDLKITTENDRAGRLGRDAMEVVILRVGLRLQLRAPDDDLDPRHHLGHPRPPVRPVVGAFHGELQQPHHLLLHALLDRDAGVEHLGRPLLLHHRAHPQRQLHAAGAPGDRVHRRLPRQRLEEQHAEAVRVRLLRRPARVGDLGGAVPGDALQGHVRADEPEDAVVGHVGAVARVGDEDVGRLDVAVARAGAGAVDERDAARGRQRDARPRLEVQPLGAPAVEEGAEAAAAHEVVHDQLLLPAVEVRADRHQVLVPERAQRDHLVPELPLRDGRRPEPLHGHGGGAALQRGAVRRAQPALPDHLGRRVQKGLQIVRRVRRRSQEHQLLVAVACRGLRGPPRRVLHVHARHGDRHGRPVQVGVGCRLRGFFGHCPLTPKAEEQDHGDQNQERHGSTRSNAGDRTSRELCADATISSGRNRRRRRRGWARG